MNNKEKKSFKFSTIFLLLILTVCVLFIFTDSGDKGKYISINEAYEYVETNKISDVYASNNGEVRLRIVDSAIEEKNFPLYADYYFTASDSVIDNFIIRVNQVNEENREYNTSHPSDPKSIISLNVQQESGINILDYLMPLVYLGVGIVAIIIIMKMITGSNKNSMNFGKSRAKATTNVKVRFSDVAGADEEKEELAEIVEFLRNPQKFTDLGARIPKGVLLVGNPGTGKTLLARAVAGESNVPFLTITGSDFVEMFVGVGAARVRDLFEQAKKLAPCIVFIDEIDAVGRQRGTGLGGGNDEREQTLNQLLVEMDGFEANEGIIVLAATNRSDVLDPALLRPGRFDRQIYVHIPDVVGREGILKIHARNKPLYNDVDFKVLARMTSGFTGADIENMLNEAAILAARNNRPKIIMADILEGINKVIMGPQKKSRLVTEKDKKITAYHESGHAILGKLLPNCEPVQEVSIIPRGMAAGYTMSRPDTDDNHVTYNKLNDQIAMIMGGRLSEEIIFGDISTGASNDIQKATEIARKMVTEWGMSKKLGFANFSSDSQVFIGRDYQTKVTYSEKTAGEIDDEISAILKYNYDRAKKLLSDNKKLLDEMTKLLLLKETIFSDEVNSLMEGKTAEEIAERMDELEKARQLEEEKHRKEFEIIKRLKEIELKLKTGEMYFKNGIITENDLNILKQEKLKIEQELLDEQNKKVENKPNVEEQKQTTETKSKKPKTTTATRENSKNNKDTTQKNTTRKTTKSKKKDEE